MRALKQVLAAAAVAVGLGFAAGAAEAAPAGSGLAPLKAATGGAPLAEKAYWVRRCWWSRGRKHCRRVWVRPHRPALRFYYGPRYRPYYYAPRHRPHRRWR
jgi:hypothetical protein